MRRLVFKLLRAVVRLAQSLPGGLDGPFASAAAWWITRQTKTVCSVAGTPRVAVFSAFRFRYDLNLLADTGRLTFLELPVDYLQAVNALFSVRPDLDDFEVYNYYAETDERCLRERANLAAFVAKVSSSLIDRLKLDAAITPGVFYEYEIPWSAAFKTSGVPFLALHKEFTVMGPDNMLERAERFKRQKRRYYGSEILVVNKLAARLFAESGVASTDQVRVVGLPRMDALFKRFEGANDKSQSGKPKRIALFSFAHYGGDLEPGERRSKLFSKYDHEGFVRLFNEVHGLMAKLALEFPNADFIIKPKIVVDWWVREIDAVVKKATGRTIDQIGNLSVENYPPHDLLEDSDAVIGFNSTVLLESKIAGKPTILPLFAEAVDKYPNNVYLREKTEIFHCPNSADALKALLTDVLNGKPPAEPVSDAQTREAIEYYLGYSDGGCTQRVIDAIYETADLHEPDAPAKAA